MMTINRYSIHHGGKPDSPELFGFDEVTCERIWNIFLHEGANKWGRVGLGTVCKAPQQMGYDLHVNVTLESNQNEVLDCWMWSFD